MSPKRRPWSEVEADLLRSDATDLASLVKLSGLDPARHMRYADWSGNSFAGSDLAGFDFTGANLEACDFTGARIAGARFEHALLGRVIHDATRDPTKPGLVTPVANLRFAADYQNHCRRWKRKVRFTDEHNLPIGAIYQDAPFAPEMVVIPPGRYFQGDETKPVDGIQRRAVTFDRRLAISRFPVTFDEWDFAQEHFDWQEFSGIAPRKALDHRWGRGRRPVVDVSWHDAKAYCKWLGALSDRAYRLLSEVEWEYACRAGTGTSFSTGDTITPAEAQFSELQWGSGKSTVAVGSFQPNAFGLYDMHGNVWEWCEEVWTSQLTGTLNSPSVKTNNSLSGARILRGGSWFDKRENLSASNRYYFNPGGRNRSFGFRVARTLLSSE